MQVSNCILRLRLKYQTIHSGSSLSSCSCFPACFHVKSKGGVCNGVCGAVPGHICPISPESPPHGCQLETITVRRGCKLKLGPRPPELRLPDPTKPNYPIQTGTVTCSGIRINSLFRIAPQLHSSRVCLVIPSLTTSIFSICPNIYFLHIQRDGDIVCRFNHAFLSQQICIHQRQQL